MLYSHEIIENIRDDMNGIQNELEIVDPIIENEIFFEDFLEKDRLNDDVDLEDDARIRSILGALMNMYDDEYVKKVDRAYIRKIQDSELNIRMHLDGGANRSVTDDLKLLHDVREISQYTMHGAQKGDPSIVCTKVGHIKLMCRGRGVINVRTFFSPDVSETILSPGDITTSSENNFSMWDQRCDYETGRGYLRFSSSSGIQSAVVDTKLMNGLWYACQSMLDCVVSNYDEWNKEKEDRIKPIIRRLSKEAVHALWHQRLCHPGETVTQMISKTAEGVPNLNDGRNAFFKCNSCMRAKMERVSKLKNNDTRDSHTYGPGQMFHMDFGFVRGSEFKEKEEDGRIVTSRDGYNAYLIIVDKYSGYTWIMLARSKDPPIEFVRSFLNTHKDRNCSLIKVRTDQGGELWGSHDFQEVIQESKCVLEPTGAGDPAQNGKAEAPNKTYGKMMRSMLDNAGLGPEFWSYALLHAVYVKNRLPHSSHQMRKSPYEAYSGIKPNLSLLRVWGCRVIVKDPQLRKAKLDSNTSRGIFLRYTATDKNIVFLDVDTNMEKIASHVVFDEANYSIGSNTPGSKILKELGTKDTQLSTSKTANDTQLSTSKTAKDTQLSTSKTENYNTIKVKKLHENAKIPIRANATAAGMDLFTPEPFDIDGQSMKMVRTGFAISMPHDVYGRLAPRSGLTVKKNIDVRAGVVDSDYRGEVVVVLQNMGKEPQRFQAGDKIAQLILEKISDAKVTEWSTELDDTCRGEDGFGSTDPVIRQIHSPYKDYQNVTLSTNPFGPSIIIECKLKGNHSTLGLTLDETSMENRLTLMHCEKGTPAARIPRWRSELRGAVLAKVNNVKVQKIEDVERTIEALKGTLSEKARKDQIVKLEFMTVHKVSIHPQKGIPQIYYDQLNIIAAHQLEMKENASIVINSENVSDMETKWEAKIRQLSKEDDTFNIVEQKSAKVVEKLTRRILMKRDDWNEWQASEAKQLNQYVEQGMFGEPEPRPSRANILCLIWTYLIKTDGTKKSRCCCNGNPGRKGSITLDHTYAACVEQPAQRVYWGLVALKQYIAIGADASNAFAEAPPPKAPLYVLVDKPYREWYKKKHGKDIPKGYVLRVHHAIQGHPEAPRLWSTFIDEIIRIKLNFVPTTHEKCLYRGTVEGVEVLFLRQVDDFSVASKNERICNKVIDEISKYLKAPLKNLGRVTKFNGVQVQQTQTYIKLHNTQYIEKILNKHGWMNDKYASTKIIPMRSDSKYVAEIEQAKGPEDTKEKLELEMKMKFNYRQALGEVLYAMVTCRPDISIAVTKLSQYSQRPAEIHYVALKNIFRYLRNTRNDGLIFWRSKLAKFEKMEEGELPKMYSDNVIKAELMNEELTPTNLQEMYGFVDSDWAGDTDHRKSITGIAIMFAGSVIAYKSKIQRTVALSSTEAEFTAACEAGKTILYLRTILDDMGVDQNEATVLFEDNQGALLMANAQQPTRRTRHLETATFALQDWVARDLICLKYVSTTLNSSDGLTKPNARILFYKHFDRLMGRLIPKQMRSVLGRRTIEKENKLDHTTMKTIN